MNFVKKDIDSLPRREYFRHYMDNVRCTYSMTINVDITGLYKRTKKKQLRLHPVLLWWISEAVNSFEFMRWGTDEEGNVGVYTVSSPSFTVMGKDRENFNVLHCPYSADFHDFYNRCKEIIDKNAGSPAMNPIGPAPAGSFDISAIPWAHFTAFELNLYTSGIWMAPIITTGKLIKEADKVSLPFNIKVHHRVCDGAHLGKFFAHLEDSARQADEWMNV